MIQQQTLDSLQSISDVDGNIQPEAIDALLFSITDYMVDNYNNVII